MCMDHTVACNCGKQRASFNFRNEIMNENVITGLYCPECAAGIEFDRETMIADNGWVIEYDMSVAGYFAAKDAGDVLEVTPEILFDQGYATWRGVYPGDHIDSAGERAELFALAKSDKREYFEQFKVWGKQRMERLQQEGWRKANA